MPKKKVVKTNKSAKKPIKSDKIVNEEKKAFAVEKIESNVDETIIEENNIMSEEDMDTKVETKQEITDDSENTNIMQKEEKVKGIIDFGEISTHSEEEKAEKGTDNSMPDDNIDDVIEECTGSNSSENKYKPKKQEIPWYVARASRDIDYYNW